MDKLLYTRLRITFMRNSNEGLLLWGVVVVGRARSLLVASVFVVGISAIETPAHADAYFFSFSGAGVTANGIITVDGTAPDLNSELTPPGFDVTSITGTYNGSAISLVSPSGCPACTLLPPPNNILYFPGSPTFVDDAGLLFSDTNGDLVNLFSDDVSAYTVANCSTSASCTDFADASITNLDTFTVTPTPIPYSLPMLGSVLIGGFLLSTLWNRRKSNPAVSPT